MKTQKKRVSGAEAVLTKNIVFSQKTSLFFIDRSKDIVFKTKKQPRLVTGQ